MTHPLVSILTPSYNQARWLPDNLRSVAGQSYPAIEHIVADGGSTDGTVGILSATSPTVAWESGPDEGQSDAINKAFYRSTGDIIGWLNSDDAYFSRDVVANAVRVFQAHPEVGLVYGHAALVNGAGTLLYVLWTPPYRRALLRSFSFVCQPTVFVRRSVVRREFFVDPAFDYMMDRELWLHLSERTIFRRLDQIVAVDRHHPLRKSYTLLDVAARDDELIRKRYRLPGLASNRVYRKSLKVALRIAGLSKVGEAAHGGDTLSLDAPSRLTIAVRQVAQLRSWMPMGMDSRDA